jgi:sulfur carrier protein
MSMSAMSDSKTVVPIRLNGKAYGTMATSIAALLAERGIDASRPGIAVAANQKVVKRSDWAATPVSANDDIEIVQPFQGG